MRFLLLLACFTSLAERFIPSGEILSVSPATEIQCAFATNHLPSGLWLYRTEPRPFPPSVISNLVALGRFTNKDKSKAPVEDRLRKGSLYFATKDGERRLGIYPATGVIEYADRKAKSLMKESVKDVPSDDEVLKLGLRHLELLEIPREELAVIPETGELRVLRQMSRRGRQGEDKSEVYSRGIFFIRSLDRIAFQGVGQLDGVTLNFGNEGKVAELEVVWSSCTKDREIPTPSTEKIVNLIRNGSCATAQALPSLEEAKKITLTKATPYYLGLERGSQATTIRPFLLLDVEILLTDGKTITANCYCPVRETKAR